MHAVDPAAGDESAYAGAVRPACRISATRPSDPQCYSRYHRLGHLASLDGLVDNDSFTRSIIEESQSIITKYRESWSCEALCANEKYSGLGHLCQELQGQLAHVKGIQSKIGFDPELLKRVRDDIRLGVETVVYTYCVWRFTRAWRTIDNQPEALKAVDELRNAIKPSKVVLTDQIEEYLALWTEGKLVCGAPKLDDNIKLPAAVAHGQPAARCSVDSSSTPKRTFPKRASA